MNKFKVGDRVRVYSGVESEKGTVLEERSGLVRVRLDSAELNSFTFYQPKQCRKLKTKKKRYVFVQTSFFDAYPDSTPLLHWTCGEQIVTTSTHGPIKPPGNWIRFIEAKDQSE